MTPSATDIWFRTASTLASVAEAVGLVDTTHDAEDHWEWVIGTLDTLRLDVTRTHTRDAIKTDTRIFRIDNQPFADSDLKRISTKLLKIAESDICWGQWKYKIGNGFDKVELSRLKADRIGGEQ